jgi:molybdopterin-containing oxidoreductase family iron-sulfur binding subunit
LEEAVPEQPPKRTRREFTSCVAAAAAGFLMTACGPRRLHEVPKERLRRLVREMEQEYSRQYSQEVRVSDAGPLEGVLFGYALDISRCIGCRRCVYACVDENNQSRDPEVQWIRVLQMDKEHGVDFEHADPYYDPELVPQDGHFYVPVSCQHCSNAPCTKVCPTGATWTRRTASSSSTTTGVSAAGAACRPARTARAISTGGRRTFPTAN